MDIIDQKSDRELLESLLAECAKSSAELKCAQADLQKAQSRLKFLLLIINDLVKRNKG